MLNRSGGLRAALLLCLSAVSLLAVETRVWDQSDFNDFTRGTSKSLAIRSDGRLTLAPVFKELDTTSIPYLWALARDSKGTVYYAGGAPTGSNARVFRLTPGGKPSVLAELSGLEVHALAVDSQDRVYAAVLPDAKIYRIGADGKPQLFFDPKCKYIWSMACDRSGHLLVATGESGILYRVGPDGKGEKFFDSEENHIRSLLVESNGDVVVGTEPSGLVLRIDPNGKGFVLYETNRREVTALAEHEGVIYAASVGSKIAPAIVTGPAPVLPGNPSGGTTPAGTQRPGTAPPAAPPALASLSASINGGSEVYRIAKDGFAERVWSSSSELVYALGFDPAGKPLLGTGNKGVIYRIDSDQLSTQLRAAAPTQILSFLPGPNGSLYVATGNVGNLYQLGPAVEQKGSLTSDVLDARQYTVWGKAHLQGESLTGLTLETRSGNVNNPENGWTPWSAVSLSGAAGQVPSPSARFLQYRLSLTNENSEVSAVDIAYLPRNVAPRIRIVEVAPLNYRQAPGPNLLERNTNAAGSPTTLTLPAVGQRRSSLGAGSLEGAGGATLQYNKGFVTVRWNAFDANDDPLTFRVEIAPRGSGNWQLLKDHLSDRYYSFDTTAFSDGDYRARITASDAEGNIPSEALTGSLESDIFHIDNTPPAIENLQSSGGEVSFAAADATSWIGKAEYSLDGADWLLLNPVNKVTDGQRLEYRFRVPAGHSVAVRVFDENDNVLVRQTQSR